MNSADLFVIGGGPAGLAAAIAARRRGLDVLVSDAAVPPIDKACGEGIMPDGLESARALGLDFEAVGQPFRGIRFAGAGRSVQASFPQGYGLGMRRTVLHELMIERASALGVRFRWGAPINGLDGIRARWIVGADGAHSRARQWAGLDADGRHPRRYGFRRHFRAARQSELMEIHWGRDAQLYLTPIAPGEICAVLISRYARPRLAEALAQFPEAAARLGEPLTPERGALTISRRFPAVWRGNLALIGDASGSVDAITGEGLCLVFRQAEALGEALAAGDLEAYGEAHRRIGRRPQFMARFMLLLDGRDRFRARVLRAMAARPPLFAQMLAMHVGELSSFDFVKNSLALGWEMVSSL